MQNSYEARSQWHSTNSYILVTIGAIVGLGNIIQFPIFVTQYGGLFVLFYVLCEIFVSIPLLFSELMIGRSGKQNAVGSIGLLALRTDANRHWRYMGWFFCFISLLTLSYYTVQAAFSLGYFTSSLKTLMLFGTDEPTTVPVHGEAMTSFFPLEIFFILFLIATLFVIARGINRGLEKISAIVVPTYFIILLVLAIYTGIQGDFLNSLKVLFNIHADQSILTVLLAAMGYAFFKLNVGMGTMIVYGSYLPYSTSFGRSTAMIVIFDAIISLLAYFVIYPLMLQSNDFITNLNNHNIIYLFANIPNGILIAVFFFLAAVLAAWTCTIAMAEMVAVTLIERFNITRFKAVIIIFILAMIIGSFAALTHTDLMHTMLTSHLQLRGITRNITSNILTPIAAILIAIFVGWVINKNISLMELNFNPTLSKIWLFLVRIAPVFLIGMLIIAGVVLF